MNIGKKLVIRVPKNKNTSIENVKPMETVSLSGNNAFPLKIRRELSEQNLENIEKSKNNNKNTNKTAKKKKPELSSLDKSKLWDIFDSDRNQSEPNATLESIQCVYTNDGTDLCNLCKSQLMIMEDGFPTCTNIHCGVMYKDTLDYSPEWRFYNGDDKNANDPTRCGNPINPLLVESSFGCKVLCTTKSSYEMKKIRKWTEWQSMPHKEKSLYDEFQFITIMAQNAGIPKIFIDDAMAIHKDISEQKMFRGMNRDGIKSASIYISCRLNGCPRTAHEIAEIFRLDKTSATNGCSMAVNILHNIERNVDPSKQADLCVTLPSLFIERYCSRLNFNQELTMLAKFVANKVEKKNLITDNIPHAIAAGIVYFVAYNCQMNVSKQDIKVICGVSEVTINKCFKKLEANRENFLPTAILEKYN
uniref:Cyclin-like domain-containing protein n=1 Tax=viral metagenome TaxID=1070528 RepID=A0A6C0JHG0_9ZZZZ